MTTDHPKAGLYKTKRVRNGPWVGVRLWHEATHHEPGNPDNLMDRSPIWRAERDGQEVKLDDVWPWAGFNPIDRAEFRYLLADASHARRYRPDDPEANPTYPVPKPIKPAANPIQHVDIGSIPSIF